MIISRSITKDRHISFELYRYDDKITKSILFLVYWQSNLTCFTDMVYLEIVILVELCKKKNSLSFYHFAREWILYEKKLSLFLGFGNYILKLDAMFMLSTCLPFTLLSDSVRQLRI